MELTFINPGFESMLESILAFQTGDETAFWTEPLYHFYPQLNRELAASLPFSQRAAYLRMVLEQIYREQEGLINEKVHLYSGYWDRCRAQITEALSEAFGLDCAGLFNDMTCHVSMNPICPRFLQSTPLISSTSTATRAPLAWPFMRSFILSGFTSGTTCSTTAGRNMSVLP